VRDKEIKLEDSEASYIRDYERLGFEGLKISLRVDFRVCEGMCLIYEVKRELKRTHIDGFRVMRD
jgi:hypothetical protein